MKAHLRSIGLALFTGVLLAACGGSPEPGSEAGAESAAPGPAGSQSLPVAETETAGVAPASERFQLGTHYQRLSPTQPTSSGPEQIEVGEIFWYGCPHCYAFEPYLKGWLPTKLEDVSFVRVPAVWNPLLELHARAFYTAEALGKAAEMHDAFFTEIHENGNPLDTEAALAEFFGRFGVTEEDFNTTFDSFAVHEKLQRANELGRRYQITSVPSIVVNGKYTANAGTAGGYDQLIDLIGELTAAERSDK